MINMQKELFRQAPFYVRQKIIHIKIISVTRKVTRSSLASKLQARSMADQ